MGTPFTTFEDVPQNKWAHSSKQLRMFLKKNRNAPQERSCYEFQTNIVGMRRLELPTSTSRTWRAANCATSRLNLWVQSYCFFHSRGMENPKKIQITKKKHKNSGNGSDKSKKRLILQSILQAAIAQSVEH